jgi:GT2 family glycosyltransferase
MESRVDRILESGSPRVAVLILNWNDKSSTLETLESVRGLTYPHFEVFLVDNVSADMSRKAVADRFPEVRIISSPVNLGVAGGRNLGLKVILERPDIDYVLFLDNDVTVESRLLDKLVEAAESQADLGIIGPTIYYSSDPRRIWSARGGPSPFVPCRPGR